MNNQNKHYQQLTQEPRYQISGLRKAGMSLRAIAKEVGVHFSTVSQELRRNATGEGYNPQVAHQLSDDRRKTASKAHKRSDSTDRIIKDSLILGWSPEAISQRLMLEKGPDEHLCHTTVYRRIEEDRLQGGTRFTGNYQDSAKGVGKVGNATRKLVLSSFQIELTSQSDLKLLT